MVLVLEKMASGTMFVAHVDVDVVEYERWSSFVFSWEDLGVILIFTKWCRNDKEQDDSNMFCR